MIPTVIDFETFYDRTYSLSKLSTEAYIRDPQFEVIGVSVKVDTAPARWFSGTKSQTKKFLCQYDWSNTVAIAHNAMFDMAILSWHFDIVPKRIVDTLSMARALHGADAGSLSLGALAERYGVGVKGNEVHNALGKHRLDFTPDELACYGNYCCNDGDLTYAIFARMAPLLPPDEARLIDMTIRMFTEPTLELDKALLEDHLRKVVAEKESLLNRALVDKADLMSNPKLAHILLNCGVLPPMKTSPATGKPTYAFSKTDEEFKALLDHEHPIVQNVVAARLGVKSTLEETRTQRFIDIASRGNLPIPLRYCAAHTTRWGGDDKLNMQNLPRGSVLKKAIKAPKGYVYVDCDSSQIEARLLAWFAGQHDLVEAFDKGEDVYRIMATYIYGKALEEINEHPERFVGKQTILGAGYGMGWLKFQTQLKAHGVKLTRAECEYIISVYRQTYPAIPMLWKQGSKLLEAMIDGYEAPFGRVGILTVEGNTIKLPNGLYLRYPNLRRRINNEGLGRVEIVYDQRKGRSVIPTRIYGGKLVENVMQGLARTVIGEQMLQIGKRYKVALTVHDATGALVPSYEAEQGRSFVEAAMRVRPKWAPDLPLNCESKMGVSYGG